jgi:hypothetical protein
MDGFRTWGSLRTFQAGNPLSVTASSEKSYPVQSVTHFVRLLYVRKEFCCLFYVVRVLVGMMFELWIAQIIEEQVRKLSIDQIEQNSQAAAQTYGGFSESFLSSNQFSVQKSGQSPLLWC